MWLSCTKSAYVIDLVSCAMVDHRGKRNGNNARKRPAMILVLESCCRRFVKEEVRAEEEEEEDSRVERRGYGLATRKGKCM